MVLVDSDRVTRVPPYSGDLADIVYLSLTGPLPSLAKLSSPLQLDIQVVLLASTGQPQVPINPDAERAYSYHAASVWALPISLAATQGIDFSFSSSGY